MDNTNNIDNKMRTSVTLTKEQYLWVSGHNTFNLSANVRTWLGQHMKLQELMDKEGWRLYEINTPYIAGSMVVKPK